MPRRYFDYLPEFTIYHQIAGIGAFITVAGILYMIYNLVISIKKGEDAPANPWNASTLEWQIDSPPPLENFKNIPYVDFEPYEFENGAPKHNLYNKIKGVNHEQ